MTNLLLKNAQKTLIFSFLLIFLYPLNSLATGPTYNFIFHNSSSQELSPYNSTEESPNEKTTSEVAVKLNTASTEVQKKSYLMRIQKFIEDYQLKLNVGFYESKNFSQPRQGFNSSTIGLNFFLEDDLVLETNFAPSGKLITSFQRPPHHLEKESSKYKSVLSDRYEVKGKASMIQLGLVKYFSLTDKLFWGSGFKTLLLKTNSHLKEQVGAYEASAFVRSLGAELVSYLGYSTKYLKIKLGIGTGRTKENFSNVFAPNLSSYQYSSQTVLGITKVDDHRAYNNHVSFNVNFDIII